MEENMEMQVRTVTLAEAARVLGISHQKATQLARAGEFPCRILKLGPRFWRVPAAELERLLDAEPVA